MTSDLMKYTDSQLLLGMEITLQFLESPKSFKNYSAKMCLGAFFI